MSLMTNVDTIDCTALIWPRTLAKTNKIQAQVTGVASSGHSDA
jgi:hypothetical protein